jgi:signal transduction histidine kinase
MTLGDRVSAAHAPSAQIAVQDSGNGIPLEQLTAIFEPFTQLDVPSGARRGGLGLGLALVRSLAELHGGTVDAASAGAGQGSCFTVRLPLSPSQSAVTQVDRRGRMFAPSNQPA